MPVRLTRHLLFLLRQNPDITDRWGYHIRAVHYYDPLPDFERITETQTTQRRISPSVDFNIPGQLELLERLSQNFREELRQIASSPKPAGFDFLNGYFAGLDASLYYALIRELKPGRVLEIGSGYSTRIASKAIEANRVGGHSGRLTCIEPFPESRLLEAKLDIELIQKRVEDVSMKEFEQLQAGDILFIDSSHAVKFRSDVCYEFLEILPRLNIGVWIHVHDIFFPHDYPAEWLIQRRVAFAEQYLLEAFLSFNRNFSVQAANNWLCLDYLEKAERLCPISLKSLGSLGRGSFWMRKDAIASA